MTTRSSLLFIMAILFGFACKSGPCPDKSDFVGGKPPKDNEQWCEKTTEDGKIIKDGS